MLGLVAEALLWLFPDMLSIGRAVASYGTSEMEVEERLAAFSQATLARHAARLPARRS